MPKKTFTWSAAANAQECRPCFAVPWTTSPKSPKRITSTTLTNAKCLECGRWGHTRYGNKIVMFHLVTSLSCQFHPKSPLINYAKFVRKRHATQSLIRKLCLSYIVFEIQQVICWHVSTLAYPICIWRPCWGDPVRISKRSSASKHYSPWVCGRSGTRSWHCVANCT